jgi:hypothetical protein
LARNAKISDASDVANFALVSAAVGGALTALAAKQEPVPLATVIARGAWLCGETLDEGDDNGNALGLRRVAL